MKSRIEISAILVANAAALHLSDGRKQRLAASHSNIIRGFFSAIKQIIIRKTNMSCPFCLIGSVSPPSPSPQNFSSPKGSAYILLSTPLVVAFLDIAPLSRGHLLLSSRAHRPKATDLTPGEAAAIGFWLPVLGRCVMTALWGGVEGNWNVIQANGKLKLSSLMRKEIRGPIEC